MRLNLEVIETLWETFLHVRSLFPHEYCDFTLRGKVLQQMLCFAWKHGRQSNPM